MAAPITRFLKSPAAEEACEYLTGVLGKSPLLLKELDLSEDKLGDLEWEKLSALLMDSHSKLEKIMLNNCDLTEKSCSVLATVLSSKTILKEMNLNNSRLLDSGVKEICEGLKNPVCELKILNLYRCRITDEQCLILTSALKSNPSHLRELNLSRNKLGDSGVKNLSDLLMNTQFKLEKLDLYRCRITEEQCLILTSALKSNPSHLRELNLSLNQIKNTGVNHLCDVLKDSHCKLERLRLSDCSITEEGYKALASALRSNPSHLIELDLTGNDPGQSGVKKLNDLLQDGLCSLKIIRFLKSPAAEEACEYLTGVLGKSPLLLKELDLSGDKLGDLDGEKLSALLMDSHSKLEKIMLNNCELTEKSCSVLATVLSSKTILKEMNLNNSRLLDSGVKEICEGLKNPVCELKILKLSDCSITEEGYKALASALRSNPSHLIELDLTGNDPGQSGVKELNDLLQDPNCQLKTLRFLKSPAAEEACEYLTGVLGKSPLLLKELDLSGDKLGDLDGEKLSALLMDSHSKLEKIMLNNCELTEKSCSVLATVLSSKTILKEMNLNNSRLLDSGVKEICEGLKNPVCELKML
ncbi:ribonuclease inhibitor, partial [Labeo rohita]|uniref:ribonuclease inhibitor n=1 Tax=Labeo rohita TaxID=84645 RepID=UPI0021E2559B